MECAAEPERIAGRRALPGGFGVIDPGDPRGLPLAIAMLCPAQ